MSGVPSGGYYRIPRAASIEIGNIEKLRKDDDFRKIISHLVPGLLEKAALAETAFCRQAKFQGNKNVFLLHRLILIFCEVSPLQ